MWKHVIQGNLRPCFWAIVTQIWLEDKLHLIHFDMKVYIKVFEVEGQAFWNESPSAVFVNAKILYLETSMTQTPHTEEASALYIIMARLPDFLSCISFPVTLWLPFSVLSE